MAEPMEACCRNYLAHGLDIVVEWAERIHGDGFPGKDIYLKCIKDQSEVHRRILAGEPCPWHHNPQQFYADHDAIEMAGGGRYQPLITDEVSDG